MSYKKNKQLLSKTIGLVVFVSLAVLILVASNFLSNRQTNLETRSKAEGSFANFNCDNIACSVKLDIIRKGYIERSYAYIKNKGPGELYMEFQPGGNIYKCVVKQVGQTLADQITSSFFSSSVTNVNEHNLIKLETCLVDPNSILNGLGGGASYTKQNLVDAYTNSYNNDKDQLAWRARVGGCVYSKLNSSEANTVNNFMGAYGLPNVFNYLDFNILYKARVCIGLP